MMKDRENVPSLPTRGGETGYAPFKEDNLDSESINQQNESKYTTL